MIFYDTMHYFQINFRVNGSRFSTVSIRLLYTHYKILILATKNICFYNHDRIHTSIWVKIESVFISYTMRFQLKDYEDTPDSLLMIPISIMENSDIELNFSTEIFVLQNRLL